MAGSSGNRSPLRRTELQVSLAAGSSGRRSLLRRTERSVSTVARQVGYDHFFDFTKVFKEHAGVTPVEYRKGRP